MNKSQLIEALSTHFDGNKKAASHALESVLDTITREVAKGEKVEGTSTVDNGMKQVQAILFSPTTIHKDLIPILYSDRFLTPAQVDGTAGKK